MKIFDFTALSNGYNAAVAGWIIFLSTVWGQYWYLFAAFLLFNILDYATGWYKARKLQQESSAVGLQGVIKKLMYWVIIMVAFVCSAVFTALGNDLMGVDLSFMQLMGWFVLTTLTINEARSIVENIVEAGGNVPFFLIKGLAIASDLINAKAGVDDGEANTKSK